MKELLVFLVTYWTIYKWNDIMFRICFITIQEAGDGRGGVDKIRLFIVW